MMSNVEVACCSVLQCVAVCCSVLQYIYDVKCRGSVLQCVAVCCSVLQCVVVCCSTYMMSNVEVLHSQKCTPTQHIIAQKLTKAQIRTKYTYTTHKFRGMTPLKCTDTHKMQIHNTQMLRYTARSHKQIRTKCTYRYTQNARTQHTNIEV